MSRARCHHKPSSYPDAPRFHSASALISSCFLSLPGLSLSGWSVPTQWNTWAHRQTHCRAPLWCPACDGGGRALVNGRRPCISSDLRSPRGSPGRLSKTLIKQTVVILSFSEGNKPMSKTWENPQHLLKDGAYHCHGGSVTLCWKRPCGTCHQDEI